MDNTNVVNEEVVQLYLDDIIPNRFQPREVFDQQGLKELAVSIKEHGVIQPILVRKFGEKYEIIAGERRYKASTMAGLTKIPAIIKNLDDKEASKVALIENLQRRDLTPVEEARTYQKILDLDTMTQEQLAQTMGKSQSSVSNKLRLLTLPDEVQEALLNNKISERHARSLLNVNDKNTQINLLKEVIDNKMTVRELENKIKEMNPTGDDSSDGGVVAEMNINSDLTQNENNNNSSLFSDPTTVDINKIREQSNDINVDDVPVNEPPKNIDGLINRTPGGPNMNTNSFIPPMPKQEEVIQPSVQDGNGLMASMPEIAPDDNTQNNNMNMVEPAQNIDNTSLDSLFSTPAPAQEPIQNTVIPQQPMGSTPDLTAPKIATGDYGFKLDLSQAKLKTEVINKQRELDGKPPITEEQNPGNRIAGMKNNQPELNNQSLIGNQTPSNNIESLFSDLTQTQPQPVAENTVQPMVSNNSNGINEVKNLIQKLTSEGYNVTIDELNLDNEVQLIIKFK